jgi:phage shock protein A
VGLLPRLKARLSALLAPAEDPRQSPPSAYERQVILLERLRAALGEIDRSKQQLTDQIALVQASLPQVEERARQALVGGREDLARLALERRHAAALELQRLERQAAEIGEEEQELAMTEQRLATRIEVCRARAQAAAARFTAAEAQVQINEAMAGLSDELAELGGALERTEARTRSLRARASTLDELVEVGLLPGPAGPADPLEEQLARLDADRAVDAQLAALKRRITWPG